MRSPARLATGTAAAALTAAVLGLAATATVAPSAYADDAGRLEFAPATAPPGAQVTVNTGACGADGSGFGDAAELEAGEFELEPLSGAGATGRFTVPAEAEPGTYAVGVFCDNGDEASGEFQVTAASSAAAAGASSGGSSAGSSAWPKAPAEREPGAGKKPEPGTGTGTGTEPEPGLGVRPEPATPSEAWPDRPSGHVSAGVGGSVGPGTTRIAAGAGVLCAAAVAGACLVRRRAHGAQDG
ncbi:hypothetical protein [Streptomyces griseus]|uniref:hypothetical protein n=1 Tax=Streptomyces griseus TaxID=1911 RepID=UPI00083FE0B0|nr:hypothetical protein [Streptomyces griseus]